MTRQNIALFQNKVDLVFVGLWVIKIESHVLLILPAV